MASSGRALVARYRYSELPRLRALRWRAGRYLLQSDINQFYPTIYTHSVPWALHTKALSKAALKSGKKKSSVVLLGDQLDTLLQRLNDGQTHGIPIGPDTSLVVAEILLAAADQALVTNEARRFQGSGTLMTMNCRFRVQVLQRRRFQSFKLFWPPLN